MDPYYLMSHTHHYVAQSPKQSKYPLYNLYPDTSGADATVYVRLLCTYISGQKPDINSHTFSNRDRQCSAW